jgi:hypothetical protein
MSNEESEHQEAPVPEAEPESVNDAPDGSQERPIVSEVEEEDDAMVAEELAVVPSNDEGQLPNGKKKKAAGPIKRIFASRSRAPHEEYKKTLIVLTKQKWMSVRFVGRPGERSFSAMDLFIPTELVMRELDSWTTDKEVHFSRATYQTLHRSLLEDGFSMLPSLSDECKLHLKGVQDKNLEQWLIRIRPAGFATWKSRLFAKFPSEKQKLTILLSDDMIELHKRMIIGIQAYVVAQKLLKLSKTHILPKIEIGELLSKTKEIAFTGYISNPTTFEIAHEFTETVLQNQLSLRFGTGANEATPVQPSPLEIIVSNLGILEQAVTALRSVSGELHAGYDLYDRCRAKMLEEIELAPEGDHSTHTTVRGWIQSHMTDECRIVYPSLKAFSPLVTRILNVIGRHFKIPVVGKHPLKIRINKELSITGKRMKQNKKVTGLTPEELDIKIQRTRASLESLESRYRELHVARVRAREQSASDADE